jgi:hypothetical protein
MVGPATTRTARCSSSAEHRRPPRARPGRESCPGGGQAWTTSPSAVMLGPRLLSQPGPCACSARVLTSSREMPRRARARSPAGVCLAGLLVTPLPRADAARATAPAWRGPPSRPAGRVSNPAFYPRGFAPASVTGCPCRPPGAGPRRRGRWRPGRVRGRQTSGHGSLWRAAAPHHGAPPSTHCAHAGPVTKTRAQIKRVLTCSVARPVAPGKQAGAEA